MALQERVRGLAMGLNRRIQKLLGIVIGNAHVYAPSVCSNK